ncbi:LSU ribosomal protein L24P [Syntrophus gentianae]|uniref:Large ribosomal subunit protein uL24 n=1 Tax=Syntrophus gentianae TaxID=43775 RepID=A0A1H7US68_9BACT|nr:50S ribosomal protein L24 [Syntrophus gentianae]SEL99811.1 LSU ribosomal protein L24P [Syntrophus gentianae]
MQLKHLKKGDLVKVTAGKEKGKTGKVLSVIKEKNRVVIEKLNMIKRHQKANAMGKGGIVDKEGSIHASNVSIMCGKCNKETRIGIKMIEDGKKVRICKKCSDILDV